MESILKKNVVNYSPPNAHNDVVYKSTNCQVTNSLMKFWKFIYAGYW